MNTLATVLYNAMPDNRKIISSDGLHIITYPHRGYDQQQVLENTTPAKLKWLLAYLVDENLIDAQ